jgi:hypothetical protein
LAKAAIFVLVATQGINDTCRGPAQEARGKQSPFEQACLTHQEAVPGCEGVVHAVKRKRTGYCPLLAGRCCKGSAGWQ